MVHMGGWASVLCLQAGQNVDMPLLKVLRKAGSQAGQAVSIWMVGWVDEWKGGRVDGCMGSWVAARLQLLCLQNQYVLALLDPGAAVRAGSGQRTP